MGTAGVEKTAQDLQREIDELHRQQRQITERLYDPRGLRRRGGPSAAGPRSFAANGGRQRGLVRPADRINAEDQPPAKRRLSSAVVKLEEGEIIEDVDATNDVKKQSTVEEKLESGIEKQNEDQSKFWHHGSFRKDGNQRSAKRVNEIPAVEHVPRVLPKNEDPSLVSRNKRILGQLLGTLEKFRKEDKQISETDAYIQRSNALQRAEQRAREESERLRQQEREQIAEKRRRDLVLRARVAAKAEEKKLELLFLKWTEHHKRLSNFLRTKAEPAIYYMPNKPLDEDPTSLEQREKVFLEWKATKREELSEYQKQVAEQYLGNVEKELERWQNARKQRRVGNDADLQETMDKELDSHRLEHGPKTRKIPGGDNNEDEDDVEDINAGEDDMMDDVLGVEDSRRGEESAKPVGGNANDHPETLDQ